MKLLSALCLPVLAFIMIGCGGGGSEARAPAAQPAATTASAPSANAQATAQPAATAPSAPATAQAPDQKATTATTTKPADNEATATSAIPAAPTTPAETPVAAPAPAPAPAPTPASQAPAPAAAAAAAPLPDIVHAIIHVPKGDIHVSLFHKTAPITVENFVKLARSGFYDGLAFHRVEPDFVVQGGDPNSREGSTEPVGNGGPGYTIHAEIGPSNPEQHTAGTLGMADNGLNTAGSQFYITLADAHHLDGRYTVFGRVDGPADLDVVKTIQKGDRFTVVIQPTP